MECDCMQFGTQKPIGKNMLILPSGPKSITLQMKARVSFEMLVGLYRTTLHYTTLHYTHLDSDRRKRFKFKLKR
jgi:hypothetical protein